MKNHSIAGVSLALSALLFAAGCATTTPPPPRVSYPVTYNIQVGNTQVSTNAGGQNLNINATQQVDVVPGRPLYYRVESPVDVVLDVYALSNSGRSRTALGQLRGTAFTTSITPSVSTLEFAFGVSQANSSGTLVFTLSDRPLAPSTR